VNSWADGSLEIARTSTKVEPHLPYAFFDDPLDGSAPTGVKNSDGPALRVNEDDREAIGGLDGQQKPGRGRD